jgi:2-succinyl-6-hydroxy-2,4-cyclohexadiene-1-carboxylate synthase
MSPIVFLHGFLGSPSDWEPITKLLSAPCICLNLPGHNHTPFIPNFTIDIPRFHLVGYSMGGRLALQIPKSQILSLTLISTHPGLKTPAEKSARLLHDQKIANDLLTLPIDTFLSQWYSNPIFSSFRPDFSSRRNHNKADLAKTLLHYSLGHQPFHHLTNVITGALDIKFRSLSPNPIIIENASHAVHLEQPEAVAKIIQQNYNLYP